MRRDLSWRDTGGPITRWSETLARPTENQFTFGIRTPQLGPFRGVVAGVGRWLFDRYTVRLSDPSLFSPIETHTAEGQSVTAYAKDLSRAAQDTYVLVNDADRSRYLGVEIQLHTESHPELVLQLVGVWVSRCQQRAVREFCRSQRLGRDQRGLC